MFFNKNYLKKKIPFFPEICFHYSQLYSQKLSKKRSYHRPRFVFTVYRIHAVSCRSEIKVFNDLSRSTEKRFTKSKSNARTKKETPESIVKLFEFSKRYSHGIRRISFYKMLEKHMSEISLISDHKKIYKGNSISLALEKCIKNTK